MSELEKLIEQVLEKNSPHKEFEGSKEILIEALSIYHEELCSQNDELSEINQYLEETKLEYERLFMDAPVGYLIVDLTGLIVKANHYSYQLFDSLTPHQSKLQHFIADEDQDRFYFFFQQLKEDQLETSFSFKTRTEPVRYIKFLQQYVRSNETLIHLAMIDETALVTYQKQIKYMSNHDALTGVYNRHYYENLIQQLNEKLTKHFGVIFADINGLKMINDAFGHMFGDELIKKAVELIEHHMDDTMYLARIGGDEFVIILTETTEEQMKKLMLTLKEAQSLITVKDIQLSISFGYAYKRKPSQDLIKLVHLAEDRMYQNKLHTKSSGRKDIIEGILAVLHEKKPREKEHGERVSFLAETFGKVLNLNATEIHQLKTAGLLHDIGKVTVDHTILDKASGLNTNEKREMKQHPEMGYRILQASQEFKDIADIVLYHHEFYDGTGYPRGLKGESIPYLSRILAVCDAYDAMTKPRPYSIPKSKEEASTELKYHKGRQFDAELVDIFISKVLLKVDLN
ncbi:hypothetical protein HMI01_24630 [Halolactibacillus miurensis]|uniref:Diguanylate cyclase (GGDEF) domain-containing protein/HDIG domain-containing protein n=1 Tax=Halolactibacillus miurensis TaxID=306541 RepID=A0A1I6UQL9_9BACI|nr:HD domain-containing phosphohydrolase [Halolactibacillus miurensis]GEM05475.1 hypothetical protein HMI01_24630 [Halolactibacillus miurensis]SFT03752.1 diguanylate cyclase (GGDEF) domain-containing protein/HDIG domain-containing protein [Halolactibacillus miurensis]